MKTFRGWRDQQLPDGHTYVTTPGSALLFPSLCAPTGDSPAPAPTKAERCGGRTAMMPLRSKTRAQNRVHRIAAERHRNRMARQAEKSSETCDFGPIHAVGDGDPPPF